jgi:hypothetical protein
MYPFRIIVLVSLITDIYLQLTIIATDNGGLSDTGTVTISVDRNRFDPQWLPIGGPFTASVDVIENRPVLDTVYTLTAQDSDIQVWQDEEKMYRKYHIQ